MAFVVRTYEQILSDMIAHVRATTRISDFTVGSVARTILEAAALEDDEQYFQMAQLLEAFSILTAAGSLLDERLADFDLRREQAKYAVGAVQFFDSNLITDQVAADSPPGSYTITLFSTDRFPVNYPYTVRVGEGTPRAQDLIISNNDKNTGTLTATTPIVYEVQAGVRCSLVRGGVRHIPIGTTVQVPASVTLAAKTYAVEENATILPGNYYSNAVRIRATTPGLAGNVAGERVSQFAGATPFAGAGVTGIGQIAGGANKETDSEFRQRGFAHIQSLSRGTPLALVSGAEGVEDPATGQRVVSANIVEDFANDVVRVYIDDGTGFIPDIIQYPTLSLTGAVNVNDSEIPLNNTGNIPSSGWILIEHNAGNPAALVEYVSKNPDGVILRSPISSAHTATTTVSLVDVLTPAAEPGQTYFKVKNPPVVAETDRFFISESGSFRLMVPEEDYTINLGTGTVQILEGIQMTGGQAIVANYSYYAGLASRVQSVINGQLSNPQLFPGIRAAGIRVIVEAPIVRRVNVRVSITAANGYREEDIAPQVRANIENYIMSLGVGGDVIRSKIIDVAHNVLGVHDVRVSDPSGNITILENERAIPFAVSGVSLVQVT